MNGGQIIFGLGVGSAIIFAVFTLLIGLF